MSVQDPDCHGQPTVLVRKRDKFAYEIVNGSQYCVGVGGGL